MTVQHIAPTKVNVLTPFERVDRQLKKIGNDIPALAATAIARAAYKSDAVGFTVGAALTANGARNLVNLFSGDDDQSFIGNAAQTIGGVALMVTGVPNLGMEIADKAIGKAWALPLAVGGIAYNMADRHLTPPLVQGAVKGAIIGATVTSIVASAERGSVALGKYGVYGAVAGAIVCGTIGFIIQKSK